MENRIFLFFFNNLTGLKGCGQPCFCDASPMGITPANCHQLWTSGQLLESHAQAYSRGVTSTLEGLFKDMELLIEFSELLALTADFAHGMQDRGVVTPPKQLTNLG